MTQCDKWVVRLFQAGGLLIFLSGFVFPRWALLIWFLFVIYMTIGWMKLDDWARHISYMERKNNSAASVTAKMLDQR